MSENHAEELTVEPKPAPTRTSFTLTKRNFKFDCSHRLNHLKYDSPCKSLHGHSYKVDIEIKSPTLDESGMIVDFTVLKKFQEFLDLHYDHAIIIWENDDDLLKKFKDTNQKILVYKIPTTAEHMAVVLYHEFINILNENKVPTPLTSAKITVHETENNSASFENYVVFPAPLLNLEEPKSN